LCTQESQKEHPSQEALRTYCLPIAKGYEQNGEYSAATWYYLLSGENQYNREVLVNKVFQDENVANIAHAFMLNADLKKAEKYYRYFLAYHHAEDANQAIYDDYALLKKLHPNNLNLEAGLALWNRVFQQIEANGKEIVQLKEHIAKASSQKDYAKELYYLKKSYPLYVQSFGIENYNLVVLDTNIATLYNELGHYTKALKHRKKALQLAEKVLPKERLMLATLYNDMGVSYQILGSHQNALIFFEKSLNIQKKLKDAKENHIAQLYSAMARSYGERRQFSKALAYHENAIKIYERVLGKEHLETAHAYNNLGGLYLLMKNYDQALVYFEKATEIREKKLKHFDTALIQSYANLAELYKHLKKFDKA